MTDFQLLGTWVGLIGGLAGFIAVLLQARNLYVDAPRIKLKFTYALNPNDGKQFYSLEAINKGSKSITINNVGIRFHNKMHSPFALYSGEDRIGEPLPFRLDSHSAKTWIFGKEATILAVHDLRTEPVIRAYVDLATGRQLVSEKLEINTL
jgi:hypothetical protein